MQWHYCICMLSEKPITSVYSWFTSCNLNNWSVNLRIYSVIALTTTAHSIKYTCFPFVIKELITFIWYLFLREVNTNLFHRQMETLIFQWNYNLNSKFLVELPFPKYILDIALTYYSIAYIWFGVLFGTKFPKQFIHCSIIL